MNSKKPELLSPAGNLEKLKYAVDYGADAVYCALGSFGMRASAGNLSVRELSEALDYAHAKGKKVYLTMNTMPHEGEISELRALAKELSAVAPDAFIVSDPGVMDIIKNAIPDAELHLSTQASTVNSEAVNFWVRTMGVTRVVLARELSLGEIKAIRANIDPKTELECFVHGAMCVSYSGRCLLSNFFTGRNANGGRCAQPCRWKYYIREEKRPDMELTAEQDSLGTYLFSSKDMRMIEHLGALIDAGIDSLKIEGRMKSAYYTAAITNAYRIALDDCFDGKPFDKRCLRETESVSHREYGTGYFFSSPSEDANTVDNNEYIADRPFLATVTEVNGSLAKCYQRNKMSVGERANLLSAGSFGRDFVIEKLYSLDMDEITSTPHAGMEFYLEIEGARPGDIIRGA